MCLSVCVLECVWGGVGMVGCFCTCMCISILVFVCPFKVNYTKCLLLYSLSNRLLQNQDRQKVKRK